MGRQRKYAPVMTQEARESQMISLAMNQAEQQLRDGTASPLIVSHFLKLGTVRADLERRKIEADTKLAEAKADYMESQKRSDEVAAKALKAFRSYIGVQDEEDFYEDDYYDE